jgi:DNA-binding NtrC family response regulator
MGMGLAQRSHVIETSPRPRVNGDRTPHPDGRPWFQDFLRLVEASGRTGGAEQLPALRDWVDLAEAWRIVQALEHCRGNRSAAARALGIGRRTLYTKMEKLGISEAWYSPRLHGLR